MTTHLYHVVRNTLGDIIAVYVGPHLSQVSEEMSERRYKDDLLAHEGALIFCYQYTGLADSSMELKSQVHDVFYEYQDTAKSMALTKLELAIGKGETVTIEHDNGVYIIRDAFPISAFGYLDELSGRDGYIMDGKLQSEIQAALVFGHKNSCQKYREKLGVV